jgi:FKBP-type peptidyl-prolyl cis-trans isomerase
MEAGQHLTRSKLRFHISFFIYVRLHLQDASEDRLSATEGVQESKVRVRQYEQPGELVTLPSGIQYREILKGSGAEAVLGSKLSIR